MDIKIFKTKKVWRKGGLHINPDIYWNSLQGLAVLVVIAFFVFDFLLFRKVNQDLTDAPDNTAQVKTISKDRIDKALIYFSEKDKKSTEIMNSPSPIVDPSR